MRSCDRRETNAISRRPPHWIFLQGVNTYRSCCGCSSCCSWLIISVLTRTTRLLLALAFINLVLSLTFFLHLLLGTYLPLGSCSKSLLFASSRKVKIRGPRPLVVLLISLATGRWLLKTKFRVLSVVAGAGAAAFLHRSRMQRKRNDPLTAPLLLQITFASFYPTKKQFHCDAFVRSASRVCEDTWPRKSTMRASQGMK